MFKLNTKFDADSLLYLLSHFECNSHTVHRLTQWHLPPPLTSIVKSSLFTHVHSSPLSWLPGYINVTQTILVILTMAGLFLDRPCNTCFFLNFSKDSIAEIRVHHREEYLSYMDLSDISEHKK